MNARRLGYVAGLVAALAAGAVGGYLWAGSRTPATPPAETNLPDKPHVPVEVTPLVRSRIEATITAYGRVTASPTGLRTFSVPYETRIRRVLVAPGQVIKVGTPVIEVEPSSQSRLNLAKARAELAAAKRRRTLVKSQLSLQLATKQDLQNAEERVRAAEIEVNNLWGRGSGTRHILKADTAGVVRRVAVNRGQIVAPGGPLLEVVAHDQIDVRLGVESEDLRYLDAKQPVRLHLVNGPDDEVIAGHIRLVTQQVDPSTRLVNVYVTPAPGAQMLLNAYVRGTIVASAKRALIAPRAALVPIDGRYRLFTVENGHAVDHRVDLGIESGDRAEVLGKGLSPGQPVVIEGQSELEPGMAVTVVAKP